MGDPERKTITVESDNYGEVVYEYIVTVNTYHYNFGGRYKKLGSVHIVPVDKKNKWDPHVHIYVPTVDQNSNDLPIAVNSKPEMKKKIKSFKKKDFRDV